MATTVSTNDTERESRMIDGDIVFWAVIDFSVVSHFFLTYYNK